MNNPVSLGIIPSRFASSRFPGKPLVMINGVSMIERVYRQCLKARTLDELWVATDNEEIFNHVCHFCGKAVMTSEKHPSGTDRCREALDILTKKTPGFSPDIVINIQGDEPFINPETIDQLNAVFHHPETEIATASVVFHEMQQVINPNTVKIVRNSHGDALYFTRSPVPFFRNEQPQASFFLKHTGIYAFRTSVLKEICNLPPSFLERAESLEQLRWLENGFRIHVIETTEAGISIDVPEDICIAEEYLKTHPTK